LFDAKIERALQAAALAHADQTRKGSKLPYITHPVQVAWILQGVGAPVVAIQAGLLHDVVEDCEDWSLERVAEEFGEEVAAIVGELTEDKSKSWEERKLAAAEKAASMSEVGALVKAADQLHNLSSLSAALAAAEAPGEVWKNFKGGREASIEMAQRLLDALAGRCDERILNASSAALAAIRATGA
jgi:(p)ppGpp synthase/HD superfamily hydrolase